MSASAVPPEKLRAEIRSILKDADLNTLSSKKVRQMLEAVFTVDFTERKKEIDDILMAEITSRDSPSQQVPANGSTTKNGNGKNGDEDGNSTSDDDKPSPSAPKKKLKDEKKKSRRSTNDTDGSGNSQGDQGGASTKSDEELAMEIHMQDNRPSLRNQRPPSSSLLNKRYQRPPGERRRTAFNKELDLSDQLAAVVNGNQMPRSEVVKRMWAYFKEHDLLDPMNKQFVNCDETLSKLFGRKRVRAFGMLKDLARHMTDPDKYED